MKYLELFEAKNEKFWIVVYEALDNAEASHVDLFDDEKSAENCYLELINDEKERQFENANQRFLESDIIIDVDDAKEWKETYVFDSRIYYHQIINQGKYKLPEYIEEERKARKYNTKKYNI